MKTCRKDFQGRKSTAVLKLLCRNIAAGRFNWRRYCTPQTYFGQEICVTPLHCSYGQIGYTWKSHATLTLLAKQDLAPFGYNMIDPLKSWCWGSILFYPFKISRFS